MFQKGPIGGTTDPLRGRRWELRSTLPIRYQSLAWRLTTG